MIQIELTAFLILMGVPSAVTGFCFWLIQQSLIRRDKKRDDELKLQNLARERQEKARKMNELLLIKGVGAAISLGEATAQSVRRLDKDSNGQMTKALEYAQQVKHEQKDFLHEWGIENIY